MQKEVKEKINKMEEKRKSQVALIYLINEAKKNYIELCKIVKMQNSYENRIRKGEFPKVILTLSINDRSPQRLRWTVIRDAMASSLVNLVSEMFDMLSMSQKEIISFKKEKWFIDNKNIKKQIDAIHGEVIIGKIINSRKTFFAHMGKKTDKIISGNEICDSNLYYLLERLEILWLEFWGENS